jgi:hypothetical protein
MDGELQEGASKVNLAKELRMAHPAEQLLRKVEAVLISD